MNTNSAAIHVGRLVEVRAAAGYRTAADVDRVFDAIDDAIAKLPSSQRIVTVADWRRCPVMSDEAAERLLKRIVVYNGRTERSVAVASADAPTAVLQFVRLIRESRLPDRKVFLNVADAIAWLDEALTPAEQAQLRSFLAAGGSVRADASAGREPDRVLYRKV